MLFKTGPLPKADRWVAIVGARKASEGGRDLALRMAKALAERGIGIVSGGALGIDAAAHRGALEGGGKTIVVLPTPIDRPSPKQNWRLFGDVVRSGGALVSEVESGTPIEKSAFRDRNRIIAELADALVIVEARPNSGTRYTLQAAKRLGLPIAAVPWDDDRGAIARRLQAERAASEASEDGWTGFARPGPKSRASEVRSVDGVLEWLGLRPAPNDPSGDPFLDALSDDAVPIDRLVSTLGLPVARVLAHLTRLEVAGRIEVLSGGRVRRVMTAAR
jgi:DNA processing protein